jgi:hypothetical protein
MGLYLCVFDGDHEVDGVEVGLYEDFDGFRTTVQRFLEKGGWGSRFPVLMGHTDCDGAWSADEAASLLKELGVVQQELARIPGPAFKPGWRAEVAEELGLEAKTLADSFIDVDGEPLIERLMGLCRVAVERGLPILFQ